jgi:hypothetical protein
MAMTPSFWVIAMRICYTQQKSATNQTQPIVE